MAYVARSSCAGQRHARLRKAGAGSGNEYQGLLKIKVGPVQGNFNGNIVLSEISSPESYTIVVDGKGAPGFVKGNGRLSSGSKRRQHYPAL
ncbi:MAG: hypothetical protein HC804_02450 [Anaerolineae bacterium]|nr:hypothetical protein [Anaerolineae bacterium]